MHGNLLAIIKLIRKGTRTICQVPGKTVPAEYGQKVRQKIGGK